MFEHRLSAEFIFTAACCAWPKSADRDRKLRDFSNRPLDWDEVLKLARRHRVEGLLHRSITEAGIEVPQAFGDFLARSAATIVAQSLLQAAESAKLQQRLNDAGIRCFFLKGVSLSWLAYGTLGVKQAWDIDVVVDPADAAAAVSVLRQNGYERDYPGPEVPEERLNEWIRISKETLWVSRAQGLVVELHTGLVDNPYLLGGVSRQPQLQTVRLGRGIELETLQTDQLFAYLCVHGAWHGWSRLKWLADIAALLSEAGSTEVERLYRASVALGAGRSSAQALLLCSDLFSFSLRAGFEAELRKSIANSWLERLAIATMSGRGATELDRTVFGTVGINLAHLLLFPGIRFKAAELGRKFVNPEDRFSLPLPRHLRFLYPIMALPRWVARRRKLSRS